MARVRGDHPSRMAFGGAAAFFVGLSIDEQWIIKSYQFASDDGSIQGNVRLRRGALVSAGWCATCRKEVDLASAVAAPLTSRAVLAAGPRSLEDALPPELAVLSDPSGAVPGPRQHSRERAPSLGLNLLKRP